MKPYLFLHNRYPLQYMFHEYNNAFIFDKVKSFSYMLSILIVHCKCIGIIA